MSLKHRLHIRGCFRPVFVWLFPLYYSPILLLHRSDIIATLKISGCRRVHVTSQGDSLLKGILSFFKPFYFYFVYNYKTLSY